MNIIVNGGTKGIGKEVAVCLAGDKANSIIVTGRSKEKLNELSAKNSNLRGIVLDISATTDLQTASFRDEILKTMTSVDILVNMAGSMVSRLFMETREEEARMIMETNFFGPATVTRMLKPLMHEGSHIVNISSMGGFQGSSKYPGLSYYSAAKAAIACLSECLATEFSESGIKVNCLALGAVQTEMLELAFPGYKAPVSATEMAGFISDFAVNGSRYFNGKIIPVASSNP